MIDLEPVPGKITRPGVYDVSDREYHADPIAGGSLSSSGARRLLPPSCPAVFHYERTAPREEKPHWDIGHAAHKLVLGKGPDIVDTGLDNRRGNAWKDTEAAARADGAVPLLTQDYLMVHAMAAALREHPLAAALFDPDHGTPEATLAWDDQRTGTHCRCRLDWLPDPRSGRLIIPDYKTCARGNIDALSRASWDHGYPVQDAWNRRGCETLGLSDHATAFVFVFQEKVPPYVVTVVQLDHVARSIGDTLARQALDIYAECTRTDTWPGYDGGEPDPIQLALPPWVERMYDEG